MDRARIFDVDGALCDETLGEATLVVHGLASVGFSSVESLFG